MLRLEWSGILPASVDCHNVAPSVPSVFIRNARIWPDQSLLSKRAWNNSVSVESRVELVASAADALVRSRIRFSALWSAAANWTGFLGWDSPSAVVVGGWPTQRR